MEMDQGVFLRSIIFEADLPNFNSGSERSAFCRAVARGGLYTCEGVQYPMSSDVWGWVRAGWFALSKGLMFTVPALGF